MKRVTLLLIGLVFTLGFNAFAKNGNGNGNNNEYITVEKQGNFEDENSWLNGNVPSDFENIDKEMTINGTITRNGNLNPVTVNVNDTLIVDGDYENNQWGGLDIKSGAKVEIFGNLNCSAAVTIAQGGILIVHGNLTSTNAGLLIKGDLVVKGDFSTDSKTQVNNSGNLIVGGDFSHLGGGLNGHSDDIYILDPNANITNPGWGIIYNGEYGDIEDFKRVEEGTDLENIVDEMGLLNPAVKWLGTVDSDWFNSSNWKNGHLPDSNSKVEIDSNNNAPVINGNASIAILTISENAGVTVKPGALLEITKNVNNNGTIVLESTNSNLSSLMLPENPTKSGNVNVKLELEAGKKFYLGSPVKNTKLKWFYPDSNLDSDFVYVFRREPSWRWIRVDDSYISQKPELQEMEAVYGKYGEGKVLNYTGVVNNSDVTKSFESGYYLVSNPFPVAIDWDKDEGWEREGFSTTIWSWITINGYRTVQTINNGVAAIKPEGYSDENASHIPPYQAVQMKVVAGNAKLTIKREARVKNSNAPLKSAAGQQSSYNLIRIQTDNNLQIDGTLIYFNDTFINGASDEDSEKQFNSSENVPEIYTRINNSAYAINGFPELTDSEYSIPISVRNRVEADVTMAFDLKEFGGGYTVYLEDKETGSWINLLQQSEYVYTPAQMGDDHDRFVLHLEKIQQVATGINQPDTESTDDIEIVGYEDYAQIQISNELLQTSDAEIDLLDMNGRLLNKVTTRQTQNNVDLPDNSGVYIIRVNIGDVVKTGKVVR